MEPQQKLGRNLKVGDTIRVWWSSFNGQKSNKDTVIRLTKYDGPLDYLWPNGAKIALFQFNRIVGMTIINDDYYEIVDN